MKEFHFDTTCKIREIFREHCGLTAEQYEEISGEFLYLVTDIQEGEAQEEIEKRMDYMRAVFEFLYNTKTLTLREHYELNQLLEDVWDAAKQAMAMLAGTKGTVL